MPPFTGTPKHNIAAIEVNLPEPPQLVEKGGYEAPLRPLSPNGVIPEIDCRTISASDISTESISLEESSACRSTCKEPPCLDERHSLKRHDSKGRLEDIGRSLLKEKHGDVDERAGKFYNQKGTFYFRRNELREAERSYSKALRWYRRSHARSHSKRGRKGRKIKLTLAIAATLSNISAVHLKNGNKGAAVAYLEQALQLQEHVISARHEHVSISAEMANTLYNLGIVEGMRSNHDKALEALGRAEDTFEDMYGPFHIELARVKDAMGTVYGLQGQSEWALECHRQALRIKVAILDAHHPSVLRSMMDVATAHRKMGQLDEAENMYRERLIAQEVALRRAIDPQYQRVIMADIGVTLRWIDKVQRQRGYFTCIMPTITEEQEAEESIVEQITEEGVEVFIA